MKKGERSNSESSEEFDENKSDKEAENKKKINMEAKNLKKKTDPNILKTELKESSKSGREFREKVEVHGQKVLMKTVIV